MTIGTKGMRLKICGTNRGKRGTNREIRGQKTTSAHYAENARQTNKEENARHTGKNAMDVVSWATTQESAIGQFVSDWLYLYWPRALQDVDIHQSCNQWV